MARVRVREVRSVGLMFSSAMRARVRSEGMSESPWATGCAWSWRAMCHVRSCRARSGRARSVAPSAG